MISLPGWTEIERKMDGSSYWNETRKMSVIRSIEKWNEKTWLHVSVASPKRKIQQDTIRDIKKLFMGKDCYAFMIYPPKDKYINIHKNCYHLYCCLDGHPFPEFSGFLDGIKGRTL